MTLSGRGSISRYLKIGNSHFFNMNAKKCVSCIVVQ